MPKPPLRAVGSGTRFATAEAAENLATQWSDEVLACRSGLMAHRFEPYTAVYNPRLKYYFITLRCPRCTTRKKYELADSGEILGHPWYSYPPGYLAKGVGRIVGEAKDTVRKQAIKRLFQVARMTQKEARGDIPRPSTLTLLQGGEEE